LASIATILYLAPFSATVTEFGDYSRQCGQGLTHSHSGRSTERITASEDTLATTAFCEWLTGDTSQWSASTSVMALFLSGRLAYTTLTSFSLSLANRKVRWARPRS